MNNIINNDFKGKAQASALQSFIKVIKMHGLYIPFTQEALKFVKANKRNKSRDEQQTPTLAELLSMKSVTNLLIKLQEYMIPIIEHNYSNMRRDDSQYEYLIHCVNTYIQVLLDQGICRNKEERQMRKIPSFDVIGRETFNYATKLVFGPDYQHEMSEPATPNTEEERQLVKGWIQHAVAQGLSVNTIIDVISDRLKQYRIAREKQNIDMLCDITRQGQDWNQDNNPGVDLWDELDDMDEMPDVPYDEDDIEWEDEFDDDEGWD